MFLDFISDVIKGYLAVVVIWFITLIIVMITLFKRADIPFAKKIFWGLLIFIAPVLGLILYLIYGLKGSKKVFPTTEKNYQLHKNDPV